MLLFLPRPIISFEQMIIKLSLNDNGKKAQKYVIFYHLLFENAVLCFE